MKIECKDGQLCIDLRALWEAMADDQKRELARHAVFEETLIKFIIETLATGECFGDDWNSAWWFGGSTLTRIRETILPMLPEITRVLVADLIHQRDCHLAQYEAYRDKLWDLHQRWPTPAEPYPRDDYEYSRPPRLTKEQAEQVIKDFEAKHPPISAESGPA